MDDFSDSIPEEWQSGPRSYERNSTPSFPYECSLYADKTGQYEGVVTIPTGKVWLVASEVSIGFREVNCSLSIKIQDKKAGHLPPCRKRQLNVKSNSTIKDLISSLKSIYKEQGYKWELIIEVFLSALLQEVEAGDTPTFLTGTEKHTDTQFLLYPFLQKDSATLLFADGDTGKTWFSLRLALSIASGEPFLSYQSPKGLKTLFLDYEDSVETFGERVRLLSAGLGKDFKTIAPFLSYKRMYSSIHDNIEPLRKFILENDISLVILDAGADAAGGDAIDSESVLKLYNALVRLGITSLVIHHEPKNALSDRNSHFGSMYWKNRARIAWRLQKENEDDSKLIKATLVKRNNIKETIPPFYYTYREITGQSAIMESEDLQKLPEYPAVVFETMAPPKLETKDMVVKALKEHGDLTYTQLGEMTEKDADTIRKFVARTLVPSKIVEVVPQGRSVVVRLIEDSKSAENDPIDTHEF